MVILAGGLGTKVSESIFMTKSPLFKTGEDKKQLYNYFT